jgi:hypothetical protein
MKKENHELWVDDIISHHKKRIIPYLHSELEEIKKSRGTLDDMEFKSKDRKNIDEKVNYYIETEEKEKTIEMVNSSLT